MRKHVIPKIPAPSVVRVALEHGRRTAIVVEHGTKWTFLVAVDAPVRIIRIAVDDVDARCERLELRGAHYPVNRAARILKRMHSTHGGSPRARKILSTLAA